MLRAHRHRGRGSRTAGLTAHDKPVQDLPPPVVAGPRRDPVDRSDEASDKGVRRLLIELARGRDLLKPAVAHHAHPVGNGQRLVLVVGDEKRRHAKLQLEPANLVAQHLPNLGVERR